MTLVIVGFPSEIIVPRPTLAGVHIGAVSELNEDIALTPWQVQIKS